jgi:hypothetical protein
VRIGRGDRSGLEFLKFSPSKRMPAMIDDCSDKPPQARRGNERE